jgi:hypothetical protein
MQTLADFLQTPRSVRSVCVLIFVFLAAVVIASCGGSGQPDSSPQQDAPLLPAQKAAFKEASYAGRTANTDQYAAVVTHAEGIDAYFCDGVRDYWFRGLPTDGTVETVDSTGAKLLLDVTNDMVIGQITVSDTVTTFQLPRVQQNPLYRAETYVGAERVLGGWIVLPDGEQRGAIRIGAQTLSSSLAIDAAALGIVRIVCTRCPENTLPLTAAPFTPQSAQTAPNSVQKFTVIGLGDSFMAGEGAPVVLGDLDNGIQEIWSNGLPTGTSHSFNISASEQTRLARQARACHRGASGLGLAVDELRTRWPSSIELIHQNFACSGAEVANLIDQPYSGPGGCGKLSNSPKKTDCLAITDDTPTNEIRPQLPEAISFLNAQRLSADAVVMSIGGNDLGFGAIIADCVTPNFDVFVLGVKVYEAKECNVPSSAANAALNNAVNGTATLTSVQTRFRNLATAFTQAGVPSTNVFLTQHLDPLRKSANSFCAGTDFGTDIVLAGLTTTESAFASSVLGTINSQMALGATSNNWKPINSHLGREVNNAMCTSQPWHNTIKAALKTQGNDYIHPVPGILLSAGMVHPNQAGQRDGYKFGYSASLNTALTTRFTPKSPRLFRVAAFRKQGGASFVDLRWDDTHNFESKNTLFGVQGGVAIPLINTGPDATQLSVQLNGTTGSFKLNTCLARPDGTELCSAFSPTIDVDVKIPTHSPSITQNEALINPSTPKWSIGWNDTAPSRMYSTLELDETPSDSPNPGSVIRRLAVTEQTIQIPFSTGLKSFRIAACNTLGCGQPTSWRNVPAAIVPFTPLVCLPPKRIQGTLCI